jgi:hypothetical protein
MIGMSGPAKENVGKIVNDMFDSIALQLIGDIPRLRNKKLAIISMDRHFGLAHLFVQAMQNKTPNQIEQDLLRGLLNSTDGYIESLKNKTRSNVTEAIDGLARAAQLSKDKITKEAVQAIVKEEMQKAKTHMAAIVESEATKLRNLGTLMNISRIATGVGDNDPTVFFVVVKDGITCKECIRLHLMPDQTTPRLWKFSELKQGYHKRNENNPSAFGLHPHCRCTLVYLSKGFSFDESGKTEYHSENHDAYKAQREE